MWLSLLTASLSAAKWFYCRPNSSYYSRMPRRTDSCLFTNPDEDSSTAEEFYFTAIDKLSELFEYAQLVTQLAL
jgi:hypothetical protein